MARGRPQREFATVAERLYWAYADLAKAHAAVTAGATSYSRVHFMIRAKLFKGLRTGTMSIGSLLDDERVKMTMPSGCAYCGEAGPLTLDHLVSRHAGGLDVADNVVWACRRCNSSKGARDLLVWYAGRNALPPLLLLRRYLKLAASWFEREGLLGCRLDDRAVVESPFRLDCLPAQLPSPSALSLWTTRDAASRGTVASPEPCTSSFDEAEPHHS